MKKEFVRLSGILCIITLIAAFLLAGVNAITEERIEIAQNQANVYAMNVIFPDADSFKEIKDGVNEAFSKDKSLGYCIKVSLKGFGDKIEMMVGITNEDTISGIEILSHSETPGLGAKAANDDFKGQFKGKNLDLTVVKTSTENNDEVKAITGATITSRAVTEGVKEAKEIVLEVKGDK